MIFLSSSVVAVADASINLWWLCYQHLRENGRAQKSLIFVECSAERENPKLNYFSISVHSAALKSIVMKCIKLCNFLCIYLSFLYAYFTCRILKLNLKTPKYQFLKSPNRLDHHFNFHRRIEVSEKEKEKFISNNDNSALRINSHSSISTLDKVIPFPLILALSLFRLSMTPTTTTTVVICILMTLFGISQSTQQQQMDVDGKEIGSKVLSRKKRFLIFPTGEVFADAAPNMSY